MTRSPPARPHLVDNGRGGGGGGGGGGEEEGGESSARFSVNGLGGRTDTAALRSSRRPFTFRPQLSWEILSKIRRFSQEIQDCSVKHANICV